MNIKLGFIDSFIYYIFLFTIFTDQITGYFLLEHSVDIKISQLLKMVLMFFLIFRLVNNSKYYLLIPLFWLSIAIISALLSTQLVLSDTSNSTTSLADSNKILLLYLSFFYFYQLFSIEKNYRFFLKYQKSVFVFFVYLILSVWVGFFGIGHSTYGELNYGFKGYYFSGNEFALLFFVTSTFVSLSLFRGRYFYLISFFSIITAFLIGTKSVMLGVLIMSSFLLYQRKNIFFLGFVFLFFLLLLSFFVSFLNISGNALFDKFLWVLDNRGIQALLFSGREIYIVDSFSYLYSLDVIYYLFGVPKGVIESGGIKSMVEIDWADVIMWFGLVGFYIVFFLSIIQFYILLYNKRYNVLVFFFLIMGISSVTGHVIISALSAMMISLTLNFKIFSR